MADLARTSYLIAAASLPFTIAQTFLTAVQIGMTLYSPWSAPKTGAAGPAVRPSVSISPENSLESAAQLPAEAVIDVPATGSDILSLMSAIPVQAEPAIPGIAFAFIFVVFLNFAMALTVAGIVSWIVRRETSSAYVVTTAILGGFVAFHAEYMIRKFAFGSTIAPQPDAWITEGRSFFLHFCLIWLIYALVLHVKLLSPPFQGSRPQDAGPDGWTLREQRNHRPAPPAPRDHKLKENAWVSFCFGFAVLQVLLLWNTDDLRGDWTLPCLSVAAFFVIRFLCIRISRWSGTGSHV